MQDHLTEIYPVTCQHLPEFFWTEINTAPKDLDPTAFPDDLQKRVDTEGLPGFLPELARLEHAIHQLQHKSEALQQPASKLILNTNMKLLEVTWQPLLPLLDGLTVDPHPGPQLLLLWKHPGSGKIRKEVASPESLLALKLVAEERDVDEVALSNNQPVGLVDAVIETAIRKGILLSPPSKLRRNLPKHGVHAKSMDAYVEAEVFTLQWHITHRCDLHCRHCYDRSDRKDVSLETGLKALDQLRRFCLDHHVAGQVSFSGGNPFLHPDFTALYQAASDRNLNIAILGNPVTEAELDTLLEISKPAFFQVSLEGLEAHNDHIRGQGSFKSVLAFLELLKAKQVYSMVMLTLTRANLEQVLPLAEVLRDRADLFTYNRLAMVGEGANLESPGPKEYQRFVANYLDARRNNPVMALKDSLINIELDQREADLFGGCTGFGCGAAFNFVSLLPDGEVHACRKFPSPIGNINQHTLSQIYQSPMAEAYRRGCRECDDCHLRLVCGGCLAVAQGWGQDPLLNKDPGCFLQ